jgi:iron complex outermembrane receptor protein
MLTTPLSRALLRTLTLFAVGSLPIGSVLAQTAPPAQTGTIEGRVLNGPSGRYVESAIISVEGTKLQVTTDLYGDYRVSGVPAGNAKIDVTYSGLTPQTLTVAVDPGQTVTQDVTLGNTAAGGTETVQLSAFVVAEKQEFNADNIAINEQRAAPNLKYVMAADAFGNISNPAGNLGEFLKFMPDVTIEYNSMDARWIMVQGVSSRYTEVSVDGMRMASAASTSPGRFFELEQDSVHSLARAEVVISRTPDLPADALGGSINMVSTSAFEYAHPEFDYEFSLIANSAWKGFGSTPGPEDGASTHKVMPGANFTLIEPVSKKFGFTIAVLDSNQYNPQYRSNPGWYPNGTNSAQAANSPYLTQPYLEKYLLQDAPKISIRENYSATADWKVSDNDTLAFSVQENAYNSYVHARGISFDTGTGAFIAAAVPTTAVPLDYGPTYTDGAVGKGSVTMYSSDRKKFGRTFNFNSRYKHDGPVWTVDGAFSFSHASAHYADAANGYPDVISLTMKSVTIDYAGSDQYGYVRPATISVFSNAATPVTLNPFNYAGYNLATVTSDPADATDVFRVFKGDLKRDWDIPGAPTTFTLGGQYQSESRDIQTEKNVFTFTPTGAAALAGNYNLLDPVYSTVQPPWGFPATQWASNNAVYSFFQANPQDFTLAQTGTGGAIAYQTFQSPYFVEEIPAVFIMGETKMLDNRLDLSYGVRGEETHDQIWGGSFDPLAGSQFAAGSIAQTQAQYKTRGAHVGVDYGSVYPSVNLSFNITNDLVFRAAYNRAVGRPDLSNIIPGYDTVNTTSLTIAAPNPSLAPEEASNFVAGFQFYPTKGGVIQADAFVKDFSNFWGSTTTVATPSLLNQLGLSQDYLGYQVTTPLNSGSAQVRGIDLNYRQNFAFLGGWESGFSVFANGTALHLQGGPFADFTNFISRTVNWGVTYAQPRFSVTANWNLRGKERESGIITFDPSGAGYEYFNSRLETDLGFQYNLNSHVSIYLNGQNVTNQPWNLLFESPNTPGYATLNRREDFGEIWQLGVRGKF